MVTRFAELNTLRHEYRPLPTKLRQVSPNRASDPSSSSAFGSETCDAFIPSLSARMGYRRRPSLTPMLFAWQPRSTTDIPNRPL